MNRPIPARPAAPYTDALHPGVKYVIGGSSRFYRSIFCTIRLLVILIAYARLAAAERIYSFDEIQAYGEPPVLKEKSDPDYPVAEKRAGKAGAVELEITVESNGDPVKIQVIASTDRAFELPAIKAAQKWRYAAGRIKGKEVSSTLREIVSFGGGRLPIRSDGTEALSINGAPILVDWVRPEYPKQARSEKREGTVTVEFVVETDGRVSRTGVKKSTDEIFEASALAAVAQWRFKPALEAGKEVPFAMAVPVEFNLEQYRKKLLQPPDPERPVPLPQEPAAAKGLDLGYPAELDDRKLPGEVIVDIFVHADGRVEKPRILWASHPAFVETALLAIEKAAFTPAKQGPLTKDSTLRYPVGFESMGAKNADVLSANRLELVTEQAPRILPHPRMLIHPVYPRNRLLEGESGRAVVEFTVNSEGGTENITLTSTDQPDYGAALRAAVATWGFKPAQGETGPISVRMRATHDFSPDQVPAETRVAARIKSEAGIGGPAGLDHRISPVWRGFPVYPQELRDQKLAGEALVEFIIDRTGRVRLPMVVSAADDAFGWAAVTALSQWVFERPTRGGEPTEVKVRIPVAFKPPEK